MQEAEAAFERMKKHYGDAVVLQDAKSLKGAEKDAEATAAALEAVKTSLASSPELGKQADGLLAQFASIRSRDHDTYAAILAATGRAQRRSDGAGGRVGQGQQGADRCHGRLRQGHLRELSNTTGCGGCLLRAQPDHRA